MLKVTSPLETRELELPAEGEVLYCCISQLILLIQGTESLVLHLLSPGIQPQYFTVSHEHCEHTSLGTEIPGTFKLLSD